MEHIGNVRRPCPVRRVLLISLLFLPPVGRPGVAQEAEAEKSTRANSAAEISEGLWPSPKLMRLMLARWSEEAAEKYQLDDQQREKARKAVVDRWTGFFESQREQIQPLANEFLEMRMELEPPSKERVQDWARRARPLLEGVREQITAGTDEYREILHPSQRIKFEIDAVQMKVGMGFLETKFSQWEKGEFEPDEFWEPMGKEREARREERRQRRKEREALEAKQSKEQSVIDAELDSWEQYVADFISRYGLDAGQRTTVLSCLTELRERALAHRDRHREEINKLEGRIAANTGTQQELQDIKDQLQRLYGPIDDMFKELQTRIAQVPTGDQRAAAKPEEPAKAEPNATVQTNQPASVEPRSPQTESPTPKR